MYIIAVFQFFAAQDEGGGEEVTTGMCGSSICYNSGVVPSIFVAPQEHPATHRIGMLSLFLSSLGCTLVVSPIARSADAQ